VDQSGNPVFIAHWAIFIEANTQAIADYPFATGDTLDIQVWGDGVNAVYLIGPSGQLVFLSNQNQPTPLGDFGKPTILEEGKYLIHFDNTGNPEDREVHLTINYYLPAPGSIILADDEEGRHFGLP
jgi:hypothetical protein